MIAVSIALTISILILAGLVVFLVLQLKQSGLHSLQLAERALELMKAASVEEHVRAQIYREREGLYRRQLEDALAEEKAKKVSKAIDEEQLEVIDDQGNKKLVDFSKLEAIGPDDLIGLS